MKIAGIVGVSVALGLAWFFFLIMLTGNGGLISITPPELSMDLIAVAVLACCAFVLGSKNGWYFLLGWLGGQTALLLYGAMPKGKSPQMFEPTNAPEAVMVAAIALAVLNWSLIPGAIAGALLRAFVVRPKK